MVPISAKEGIGIDELLEMVLLQADMLELKSNPNKQAKGVVIEAKLDPSKGPMASVLVQRGKLSISDTIVVGETIGIVAGAALIVYGTSELFSTWKMRKAIDEYEIKQGPKPEVKEAEVEIEAEDVEYQKVDEQ